MIFVFLCVFKVMLFLFVFGNNEITCYELRDDKNNIAVNGKWETWWNKWNKKDEAGICQTEEDKEW